MTKARTFDFIDNANKQIILQFFRDHPQKRFTTQDLSEELEMPKSSLSRALNELDNMGILDSEKEGKKKYYSMDTEMEERMETIFDDLQDARRYAMERRKKELEQKLEEEE